MVNREVRYRLIEDALPAFALTADEVAALALARDMLDPLEGTRILEQLDALLRRLWPVQRRALARSGLGGSIAPGGITGRARFRGFVFGTEAAVCCGYRESDLVEHRQNKTLHGPTDDEE